MITVTDLRDTVNGLAATDDTYLEKVLAAAQARVSKYVGDHDVPSAVLDDAVRQCASELHARLSAPGGVAGFSSIDGGVIRVSADAMKPVYPMLDPWVPRGI
jgi:hypothetical protein